MILWNSKTLGTAESLNVEADVRKKGVLRSIDGGSIDRDYLTTWLQYDIDRANVNRPTSHAFNQRRAVNCVKRLVFRDDYNSKCEYC